MDGDYIIDVESYDGKRIVFTKEKWEEKLVIHAELNSTIFLKNLEETIKNPEEVWEDKSDKDAKRCYYKKYSVNSYIKVIIWISHIPYRVVSAYEVDFIKETKYPELKRLK